MVPGSVYPRWDRIFFSPLTPKLLCSEMGSHSTLSMKGLSSKRMEKSWYINSSDTSAAVRQVGQKC